MFEAAPKVVAGGEAQPKEPLIFRSLFWNTNREFNKIRAKTGVPTARMKDLRSSAATDGANTGSDVSAVGDFLGHADYAVTRKHYGLKQLESKRLVAEALAARLNSA